MNVLLKGREVAFYLEDSGAKLLFAWHGFAEAAEAGAEAAGGASSCRSSPASSSELLGARRARRTRSPSATATTPR